MSSAQTHIDFNNALTESDTFNYFLFSYMYMGGGVSVADFNNDGFCDIYFTGNMVGNRLYLNTGNLEFKDVTDESHTAGDTRWMLGSTVCDINNDGWKDIYVSVSGLRDNCRNMLFINQGNNENGIPVFKEEAAIYSIDDNGKSTQGTFFDYDNDGDLDLYVANYPITSFKSPPYYYRQMMRNAKPSESGHLYRNNGSGPFTDVTEDAGLLNFGLSLSATVSDLNQDGNQDLFVSNDFTSPDFYYINNGDGTFTDKTTEITGQTSFYGMGADIADYNNDGLMDILQIDMAPEDNQRAKENMTSMSQEDFDDMIREGLHYQYRYSTLQLNRGIFANGIPHFSNAAWMADVTSTDWSWAGLFADFDLDGWKDIFITNGSRRDINNIDYFNEIGKPDYNNKTGNIDWLDKVRHMPSKPLVNYIFRNNGDLTFTHASQAWGIKDKSFSNGAAYADLDNDGDLDLVVSNIDSKAVIYRNNARETNKGNFLKILLNGPETNKMGIGASVTIYIEGKLQRSEMTLSRGYESSMEPIIYFGTGNHLHIDSLVVKWPDGKIQVIRNVKTNTNLVLNYNSAEVLTQPGIDKRPFTDISSDLNLQFVHKENLFNDFEKQVLLPHKLSSEGPDITTGDVNGDGLDDFFIGNAIGSPGALFVQRKDGTFTIQDGPWQTDAGYEDTGTVLFDADNDGDLDIYVVSGGNEFPEKSSQYQDRLYINTGKGIFIKSTDALPAETISGSCVVAFDYDRDGDNDLFVGGRHVPGKYPYAAPSFILENKSENGTIRFVNVTSTVAPELVKAGMVTSAFSCDIDNDKWPDLVLAGEWMPVCIYKNTNGVFKNTPVENSEGWWFSLKGADFDKDGDIDLVGGNFGLNSRYRTGDKTFDVYADDFDRDRRSDIALCYYQGEKQYPVRSRACYLMQNPGLEMKFPTYKSFAEATISDVYGKEALQKSLHLIVKTFASCFFENTVNGKFIMKPLPGEAQLSAINDMVISDMDHDGNLDIFAAGNLFDMEVVTPRNDAGAGVFLKGDGKGTFTVVPPAVSGFFAPGNVKSISQIHLDNSENIKALLIGNNNGPMQIFKLK
ncbi:MAG TPA: VCBS repeat-containing protein [Bacteroidales bacterium]|nr:VCBS repeat-containing protein [Bacteroidales bacterium]